jgi:hypothetical protein
MQASMLDIDLHTIDVSGDLLLASAGGYPGFRGSNEFPRFLGEI